MVNQNPTPLPTTESVTRNANGTVSGISDGQSFSLPNTAASFNGEPGWVGNDLLVNGFETDDVFAVGGFQNGRTLSAISGSVATAPTGNATYEGRYSVAGDGFGINSPVTIAFGFVDRSLTADDSEFSLNGTVRANGRATGTVSYDGEKADFTGGFYGSDAVAGAFNNDTFGGVFYGTN